MKLFVAGWLICGLIGTIIDLCLRSEKEATTVVLLLVAGAVSLAGPFTLFSAMIKLLEVII